MAGYYDDIQKQRQTLGRVKQTDPALLERPLDIDERTWLQKIGIDYLPRNRDQGFLKLFPHDFIVEEVRQDGTQTEVDAPKVEGSDEFDFLSSLPEEAEEDKTLYADLVKMNLTHIDSMRALEKALGLGHFDLGTGGIKDKVAITSQRLSIKNADLDVIRNLRMKGVYLKNFEYGDGELRPGFLKGNRFTIFIRTERPPDQDFILENLAKIKTRGCINYFHTQRFGNFYGQIVGMHMFRGDFKGAIKSLLTDSAPYEMEFLKQKRAQAKKDFPNVDKIIASYSELPHTLRRELTILRYLKQNPGDYLGSFTSIRKAAPLYIQGYASWLFNAELTTRVRKRWKIQEELPLLPSADERVKNIYSYYLRKHKTWHFEDAMKQLRNVFRPNMNRPTWRKTMLFPDVHQVAIVPEGALLSFTLPSGSYATTFLNHLFVLYSGHEAPFWVSKQKYDIKASLGIGSVKSAIEGIYHDPTKGIEDVEEADAADRDDDSVVEQEGEHVEDAEGEVEDSDSEEGKEASEKGE